MYRDILKQVQFENNAKALKLETVKETDYVLVPSRQTLAIWKREIKKMGWLRTKVISINKLRKLSEQSTVTVLALEDKAFFTEIYTGIHHIQWLLYADEHKKYKAFRNRYNNDLIEELEVLNHRFHKLDRTTNIKKTAIETMQENIELSIEEVATEPEFEDIAWSSLTPIIA